ncbi:HAD-IC family P-type ATPase [Aerosakkonemataceae cyanobacterium BLCC-F154]|uniref:HAD-IC family P-type ATPase n=1 Tax=Floridaenema fluviatile BLCC-F154 TaxID=3153640 RepID=A0ABV4YHF3_9CYAN
MITYQHNSNTTSLPVVQSINTTVPGRARYKVNGLHRSEALRNYLEFRLLDEKGIHKVSGNFLTGNILVFFYPSVSPAQVAELIAEIVSDYGRKTQKSFNGNHSSNSVNLEKVNPSSTTTDQLRKLGTGTEEQRVKHWHLLDSHAVIAELDTSKNNGLSTELVEKNLQRYGPNLLAQAEPRSGLSIFIDQFKSLPVALLAVAAGCSVITGGAVDAAVIMGVVVINAAIGYATESNSEKIIHSLKSLVRPTAFVLREGKISEISAAEIAIGDILVLRPGSYVAADARLIEAKRLSIDESALTGESMPVVKTIDRLTAADTPLGDRTNMIYMGTLVTGGQGRAVVVATGKYTEMGKIQTLVGEAEIPQTPMEKQLDQAGSQLVIISGAVCGVVFGIGLLRGYGWLEMLKTSISLAVAAVPEGLPTVATTTLALGIAEMRKHNVLIRRLDAVETLGSVQTICMDKTGTLTANKMSVVELWTDSKCVNLCQGKLTIGNQQVNPYTCDELLKLIHVLALCNESEINGNGERNGNHNNGNGKGSEYVVRGSATENALIDLAVESGVNVVSLRENYPMLKINHRSEDCNYMSTWHRAPNGQKLLAVKGNPTEVLGLCSSYLKDGEILPLTETERMAIEIENENMAGKALRVLGAAYLLDDPKDIKDRDDLIWLGLVGMADPVRPGVKGLMSEFHQAGINTVMITGDQSPTAYAIGKELNLSQSDSLEILDSTRLNDLDPEVMKTLCDRVHVFARISPAHKLQVVQSLQSAGKVVAMTGDGINDAPALKAADVGVAMGHTGTDVAREVADVVLEDDNLETMIIAVSQGRTIYNNIRKSVHFLLSTNMSEIMVMLTATALGIGQPLSAMQLLWLNLVTDIFPGLALALEPPEPDVLSSPPRNPEEPIIPQSEMGRILFESTTISVSALAGYWYAVIRYGIGPEASTIGFMSLTIGQLLHALSCRSQKHTVFSAQQLPPNHYLTAALAGSLGLQLVVAAVPGLRNLLQLTPINPVDMGVITASAVLPLVVNEGTKVAAELVADTKDVKEQNVSSPVQSEIGVKV